MHAAGLGRGGGGGGVLQSLSKALGSSHCTKLPLPSCKNALFFGNVLAIVIQTYEGQTSLGPRSVQLFIYFFNDCYQDSVAVTMVWRKLSEEGELFFGHLACLREESKFSALNCLWLCCSISVRETVTGKVLGV